MGKNLIEECLVKDSMERELKAIIQQYMTRMVNDRLTAETENNKK